MSSILLVDDDAALMDALSRELEQLEYRTYVAQNADEALEVLRRTDIDVMVTDLRMRGKDGIELLRNSVDISPATRTVLMSAFATAADYKEARALGAVEVLSKPFTPVDFAAAIRRAEDFQAGFQADIVGLSLTDLLQIFHHGRRSVTVKVGREGKVHMRDGEIVHAEAGAARGSGALLELLQVQRGVLATSAPEVVDRTLSMPFETLLIGTLALIDEQNGRLSAPDRDAALMVQALTSKGPAAIPPEFEPLPRPVTAGPATDRSALAAAVAASAPPIEQHAPLLSAEPLPMGPPTLPPTARALPPATTSMPPAMAPAPVFAPPARPRREFDYFSAAGLALLFVTTLILCFAVPTDEPTASRARTPAPRAPAVLPARADEVVDPYQHLLDRAPVTAAPRTSTARVEHVTRAKVEPVAPATTRAAVEPIAPPSAAPVAPPSVAPRSARAAVASAPAPATATPRSVRPRAPRTVARRKRPAPVRKRPAPRPIRRIAAPPRRAVAPPPKAPATRAPATTAPDAPSVELLD